MICFICKIEGMRVRDEYGFDKCNAFIFTGTGAHQRHLDREESKRLAKVALDARATAKAYRASADGKAAAVTKAAYDKQCLKDDAAEISSSKKAATKLRREETTNRVRQLTPAQRKFEIENKKRLMAEEKNRKAEDDANESAERSERIRIRSIGADRV